MTTAERLAVYQEVAAKLRATGELGSELAALLVEQLADELDQEAGMVVLPPAPDATSAVVDAMLAPYKR